MREIVHLQLGQCGNKVGRKFWELISDEHGIDRTGCFCGESELQYQRINVFFSEVSKCKFSARAIMVDLDRSCLTPIATGPYADLFSIDNFIGGYAGAGNNWAKGFYTEGAELADYTLDVVRREVEGCDLVQGIQLVHSIGGGTGGGMGSLLMSRLKDEYPDVVLKSYSVIPSPELSDLVVEPYNTVMTLRYSNDHVDETFCMDNDALRYICTHCLNIRKPTYGDLNYLISSAISGITTCLRFPGQLNADLKKLLVNMVPFPRLHFFVPGYAPLLPRSVECSRNISVQELCQQLFDARSMFALCDPKDGVYLAAAAIFRGRMSTKAVDDQMRNIQFKNSDDFVNWIPNSIKTAICDIAPRGVRMCATFVANTTAISDVFERQLESYLIMLRRRAYLHWFICEGMEESEFYDAGDKLRELIDDYEYHKKSNVKSEFVEDETNVFDTLSTCSTSRK